MLGAREPTHRVGVRELVGEHLGRQASWPASAGARTPTSACLPRRMPSGGRRPRRRSGCGSRRPAAQRGSQLSQVRVQIDGERERRGLMPVAAMRARAVARSSAIFRGQRPPAPVGDDDAVRAPHGDRPREGHHVLAAHHRRRLVAGDHHAVAEHAQVEQPVGDQPVGRSDAVRRAGDQHVVASGFAGDGLEVRRERAPRKRRERLVELADGAPRDPAGGRQRGAVGGAVAAADRRRRPVESRLSLSGRGGPEHRRQVDGRRRHRRRQRHHQRDAGDQRGGQRRDHEPGAYSAVHRTIVRPAGGAGARGAAKTPAANRPGGA